MQNTPPKKIRAKGRVKKKFKKLAFDQKGGGGGGVGEKTNLLILFFYFSTNNENVHTIIKSLKR